MFDVDIWHAGSLRSRSEKVKVQVTRRENVTKVVGATSSEDISVKQSVKPEKLIWRLHNAQNCISVNYS